MKGIVIVICTVILSFTGFTQPNKIVNGKMFLDAGELDKAKIELDAAVLHNKTMKSAKAWKYRGDLYFDIHFIRGEKYSSLSDNPIKIAFDSYLKVSECSKSDMYEKDIKKKMLILQNSALNNGVNKFNESDYSRAKADFILAIEIGKSFDFVDTLAYYNCGLAYERSNDYVSALKYYKKCVDFNYKSEIMYLFILNAYSLIEDKVNFEITLNNALAEFPNNQDLLTLRLNNLLSNGEFEKAIDYLNPLIEIDPSNPILHFSKGSVLENVGKESEAIESYLKAIELKPDYFDANFNLGALYFNAGAEISRAANEEGDYKKAGQLTDKANTEYAKALIYLEAANRLKPEDRNTLYALMQLYAQNGETEKYNKMKAELKN